MRIWNFLTNSKNIERDGYLWNTIGSILIASQSVILLMVLTRTVGLTDSGIFALAFANANMFMYIGKYGMRVFQVSDAKGQFSFEDYCASRMITILLLLLSSFFYDIYATVRNQYSPVKSIILFLMCVFKAADALEDVYTSCYQQQNRLDIGAKVTTVRTGGTTVFFGVCLVVLRSLLASLILSTIFTWLMVFVLLRRTNRVFGELVILSRGFLKRGLPGACSLLRACFPLCVSAFLPFVITNTPKYAIDAVLDDEMQACYNFISMPASVVHLISNFIFFPLLYKMTQFWTEGRVKRFLQRILIQTGILFFITLVCVGACYLFGIPVLSLLYHTDLTPYKRELIILMVGGGFMGLSELLKYVITIIRCQNHILWAYVIVAVLALLSANPIVRKTGITGAAFLYTFSLALLCVGLAAIFLMGAARQKRVQRNRTKN